MNKILFFIFIFLSTCVFSQKFHYKDVIIRVDNKEFQYVQNRVRIDSKYYLPFEYKINKEIIEIEIIPFQANFKSIEIAPSPFYSIISQPELTLNGTYRNYIQLENATKTNFIKILFISLNHNSDTLKHEINLLPYFNFSAAVYTQQEELHVGEEVMLELTSNLPENILPCSMWIDKGNYLYKIVNKDNKNILHLVPLTLGKNIFSIEIDIYKPIINENKFEYKYQFDTPELNVKSSRLAYLNTDTKDAMLTETSGLEPIEIQIDNNRLLKMNKTYRIENKENAEGTLVAEIFTKNQLANNKVLCSLKVYNLHRTEQGFLYIKDGDNSLFLTNFNVSPKTTINKVKISRDGKQWIESRNVYPGESVLIKIEGESFHKAHFSFDAIEERNIDTLHKSEKEVEFHLRIPKDIPKPRIEILNFDKQTGLSLNVNEYQKAKKLDFLMIDYGKGYINIDDIKGPEFIEGSIKNIVIRSDPSKLDIGDNFYGKQYIDIEVKIFGPRNELVELFSINKMAICPNEQSIRFPYYSKTHCRNTDILFNQYLSKKTYNWDSWTRAVISIKHNNDEHPENAQQKTIEIILQKKLLFDVDVSFPAGLLIIRPDKDNIGNLSGISMAMVAQFSFYQKEKIAQLKPYKIGAGFLALNAFNFSENNSNRDMSIVILASVFPTQKSTKMSFPLYIGCGYFISQSQFFWLLGPGIRVSF